MPVSALRTVSTARNGVGSAPLIIQCKSLDFHYCDWSGSSRGMVLIYFPYTLNSPQHNPPLQTKQTTDLPNSACLTHLLPRFAVSNPTISIRVSPRPNQHPLLKATYINGNTKAICVRNLSQEQIIKKAELLRDASGEKLKRIKGGRVVESVNEGVRGVWSGLHNAARRGGSDAFAFLEVK
ncbi:39S ribosomal protein L51, mitochondrial [Varicellaria rhodocarpa]|nr:39S ribosomal protein L51, mitochondrial [Varicellaria rhodocarpa]